MGEAVLVVVSIVLVGIGMICFGCFIYTISDTIAPPRDDYSRGLGKFKYLLIVVIKVV
jgi:hypothetical protein